MRPLFILALFSLAAILITPLTTASKLVVVDPVAKEINSQQPLEERVVDFGVIGPGQKLEIKVQRPTGEDAKNTAYKHEAVWDKLFVLKESLPAGWEGIDSLFYEEPLKAFVIASKDSPEGIYEFALRTLDEQEGVEPLLIKGRVRISHSLLEATLSPTRLRAGVGQPATFTVKIVSKSSANDAFRLSALGLPTEWRYTRDVYVPHNTEIEVPYEVAAGESGEYNLRLRVTSLSSPVLTQELRAQLTASSSLIDDLRAESHGILLFPSVQQVVYSLLGIVGSLLGQ